MKLRNRKTGQYSDNCAICTSDSSTMYTPERLAERKIKFVQACEQGNTEIIKMLLDYEMDINKINIEKPPILVASKKGHLEIVKLLIEKKADINVIGTNINYRYRALDEASENGHVEVVKALLEAKADINHSNKYGNTALIHALKGGHSNMALLLSKFYQPTEVMISIYFASKK
jgi:ankyrin repeat protein